MVILIQLIGAFSTSSLGFLGFRVIGNPKEEKRILDFPENGVSNIINKIRTVSTREEKKFNSLKEEQ